MTLPNFLILGAAKAATTSLYHYLAQHSDVYMSPLKEPRFFSSEGPEVAEPVIRTRQAYERLFDAVTSERAIGEASPQYLNDPAAPGRISADLPNARLIVSLRDPVDRAYSSYLGRLCGGTERRDVDQALRRGTYYVNTSMYHASLSRYFERFDRRRIKVILFDDVVVDASGVIQDLCAFLEIETDFDVDVSAKHAAAAAPRSIAANAVFRNVVEAVRRVIPDSMLNTGLAGRVQQMFLRAPDPLPPAIRERLLAEFGDDVRRTESLIGRSLSHWLA